MLFCRNCSLLLYYSACIRSGVKHTYFVIPSADHVGDCPIGEQCHTLSYYVKGNYFKDSSYINMYFFRGEHLLSDSIFIENMDNVTFIGPSQWMNKSYWPAYQSVATIKCTSGTFAAATIKNVQLLYIEWLTLTQCGSALTVSNVEKFTMSYVSILNSISTGLSYVGSSGINYITIQNSYFYQNCLNPSNSSECYHVSFLITGETALIIYWSVFSFGKSLFASLYVFDNYKINTARTVYITIYSSFFYKNSGIGSGGIFISSKFGFTLDISNTFFVQNVATGTIDDNRFGRSAGGISISCQSGVTLCSIGIDYCVFEQNIGGGAHITLIGKPSLYVPFYLPLLFITQSNFSNNTGHFGAGLSLVLDEATANLTSLVISYNSPPINSPANQYGALFLFALNNASFIISNVSISDNKMTGLLSVRSHIQFQNGPSKIANNKSPVNGGGMWIYEGAQLETVNSTIYFTNNSAEYGGAIYSQSQLLLYEFYYSEINCPIANIRAVFTGNNASVAGNDVYGGQYFNCWSADHVTYYQFNSFFQLLTCKDSWAIIDNISKPLLPHRVSSDSFGVCFCNRDNTTDCYHRSIDIKVYPGQWIDLSLATIGMCQGISPGVLVVTSENVNVALGLSNSQTSLTCKEFTYQLNQQKDLQNGFFTISTDSKLAKLKNSSVIINVEFLSCPDGLNVTSDICVCDNVLQSIDGVHCNVSEKYPISRSGNNWLDYNHELNCTIAHRYCPFGYCQTSLVHLDFNDDSNGSDHQCSHNRSGTLCGQCQPGLSLMLGSNKCSVCSNGYLSLVIAFIMAGILLVLFLLLCNLTVSMGTVNGLLFYANVVKLNEIVFFPDGNKIPVLSQFISWLNLDLSIQTCFFDGFDGYWKTWL